MIGNPGETLHLSWQSKLGETGLYPQAKIYDNAETLMATVNLTHRQDGLYTGTTAALNDEGVYTMQTIAYEDSGHTSQSGVDEILSETISIQYSWRPSFGSTKADIDPKVIKSAIDEALKDKLKEVMEELKKKSEFNPKSDLVKTDIKQTSLRPILDKIDKIKIPQVKVVDNSKQISELKNQVISAIESIPKTEFDTTGIIGEIKKQDDKSFKNNIIKSINNLTTKKDLQGGLNSIPRENLKGDVGVIISTLRGLNMAKPQDIDRLSKLLEQFSDKNKNNSSVLDSKLEALNNLMFGRDKKMMTLLNQIVLELRRISELEENNAMILNKINEENYENL
uniref:Uncharacterized protein n=1 Tax=viral metagenome TaxID=1070528 RepID=A0A6H1ZXI9_9ZZZZ